MRDLKSKGRAAAGALASLTMIASMSAVPALAVAPGDGADGNAAADPQAEVGENAAVAGHYLSVVLNTAFPFKHGGGQIAQRSRKCGKKRDDRHKGKIDPSFPRK